MSEKYRSPKHCVLLYPDDPNHVNALKMIKESTDYLCILHDKDKTKEGELKKPHWHIILVYKNATWNSAIAEEFSIPLNYIQRLRNYEAASEYLIHANEPEKHQYTLDEVSGTVRLKNKLKTSIETGEITEGEKVIELIELIENADKYISIGSFARACAAMNRWDVFRRSGAIFLKMIEEKNKSLRE